MRRLIPLLAWLAACGNPSQPSAAPVGQYAVRVIGGVHDGWAAYRCTFSLSLARSLVQDSTAVGAGQQASFVLDAEIGTYHATAVLRWDGQPQAWDLHGGVRDTLTLTVPGDTVIACP